MLLFQSPIPRVYIDELMMFHATVSTKMKSVSTAYGYFYAYQVKYPANFASYLLEDYQLQPLKAKKACSGLEPRRDSGSITRYTVSSTRHCGLDAQAAKIDDPAEAPVSLLNQLPSYLLMKLTTKPTKPN